VTADPADAVSSPSRWVSVPIVNTLVARLLAVPAAPGRWLSDLMDDADDVWDLFDDEDLGGASVSGRVNGIA
jgi:hypothetical protein